MNRIHSLSQPILILVMAGTFIYSGTLKILDPNSFAQALANYHLLPWFAVNGIAVLLPWYEMASGLALLWKPWRQAGAILLIMLASAFFFAVVYALIRNLDIDCGCFGGGQKVNWTTAVLDVALAAGGWRVARLKSNP